MKNFLWIYRYVKPYWVYAVLNIITNIFSVIFSLFSIGMVAPFLGLLFGTQQLETQLPDNIYSTSGAIKLLNYGISYMIINYGKANALLFVCILVSTMIFFKNLFRYLGMYFLAPIRNGVSMDIRNEMHQKVLRLPLSFFSNERRGDLMARMTSDVQEIEWSILSSLESTFRDPFNVIVFLIALLLMSPQLTLFIFILLPLSGVIIGLLGKSLKRDSVKGQSMLGFLLSIMDETLGGIRIIKAFTAERFIDDKFRKVNNDYGRLMIRMYRKRDLASPLSEFLGVVVMVIVMWYGGKLIFSGNSGLKPDAFIAYIALFSQIINPAKAITQAWYNVKKGIASAERIRVILDSPEVIVDAETPVIKTDFNDKVAYKNVTFAYRNYDNEPVLKNVSVTIPKGKTIALVGQSGSGKSTMADLLPRFYDIAEGEITIDDVPIKQIRLKDLRALMGVVTQESILFNDTIFNNIAFGIPNATEADVMAAAKVANAHDFIMEQENGYQTNIGDRGNKLSGGQRQRLSIARAVLKNPPILILDEATSALDTESERLVQDALTRLMQNRTSLVIAHRLSTIQHADQIIVLQKGEILEQGRHEELLARNGAYRKLYDLQAFA